ncbi:MAG: glycoside hydrolase family 30 protein [Candidatus Azobacteroides sp.]|nr:glycoside hydrolase family 30 protein [Candidatus Azobacteroides sp.]
MQTESECGDGQNSWEHCFYIWNLMQHYFRNGISAYMYWNISLDTDSANNRWQWPQNSLISVDQINKTYRYNPEYYLMKHVSHFVKPGAKQLTVEGNNKDILAFVNPDESIIVLTANESTEPKDVKIKINNQLLTAGLEARSINSFELRPKN